MPMVVMSVRRHPCNKIKKRDTGDTRWQSADGGRDGDRFLNGLKARHVYTAKGRGEKGYLAIVNLVRRVLSSNVA